METLKKKVEELVKQEGRCKVVEMLQEINRLFLTKYRIEVTYNGKTVVVEPLEVEAYYCHCEHFHDTTVHCNELQKNRFGQLYFHRAGRSKSDGFKASNRGGFDVCLSAVAEDTGNYFFGMLIACASINGKPVRGVANVKNALLKECDSKKAEANREELMEELESNVVINLTTNHSVDKLFHYKRSFKKEKYSECECEYPNLKLRTFIDVEKVLQVGNRSNDSKTEIREKANENKNK